jgi:uncharacterized protein with NRDE domain
MCLAVFSYKSDPDFPLIFASNRDEFYERPAQPATFWYDNPKLLAGRDLKAGGTWMGLTKDYRFAALTNYRDLNNIQKNAPSRGDIVTDFLNSQKNAPEFMKNLKSTADRYNGFNLIAGTVDDLWYFNNQDFSIRKLEPGVHSLSNALLNTPWPKTEKAEKLFRRVMQNGGASETELFELLRDGERFPPEQLPSTGLSPEMEKIVSSIFITSKNYGTRCSTVIKANPEDETHFIEKTYEPDTQKVMNTARFRF